MNRQSKSYRASGAPVPSTRHFADRLRRTTIFWLFLAFPTSAGSVIALLTDQEVSHILLLLLLGLTFLPIAVLAIVADFRVQSPHARHKLKEAATAFAQAQQGGHWKKANACLHPQLRNYEVDIPEIQELSVPASSHSLATYRHFRRFWRSILRGKGSVVRVPKEVRARLRNADRQVASAELTLNIEVYSGWSHALDLIPFGLGDYFGAKTIVPVVCKLTLFRHGELWWVAPKSIEATNT